MIGSAVNMKQEKNKKKYLSLKDDKEKVKCCVHVNG